MNEVTSNGLIDWAFSSEEKKDVPKINLILIANLIEVFGYIHASAILVMLKLL